MDDSQIKPDNPPAAIRSYAVFDPGPLTCKTDIAGLEFDFNYGARIKVPVGDWRVKIMDRDSFNTLYEAKALLAMLLG